MMKLLKINSIITWDKSYNKDNLMQMSESQIDNIHRSFFNYTR